MQPRSQRPVLILVGGGHRVYRESILTGLAQAARVWLFNEREPTWEAAYLEGRTLVDTLDPGAMVAAARELDLDVRGALSWDEIRLVPTAEAAQALGLPGPTPQVVWRCRDKHQTRTALAAAGVPSAASIAVASLEQARAAAQRIGFPVVLKPRALGASFGVSVATAPDQLARAYANAQRTRVAGLPSYEQGVLVEEYLRGPEISCDSAVVDGRLTLLVLARKCTGFSPYFEEIGHSVEADDPLREDARLLEVLAQAHRAIGLTQGVTHSELRLTASGPRIVEINCRLGGDLIPCLGEFATGVDVGGVAAAVACGQPIEPGFTSGRAAAVHFFYPSRDAVAERIEIAREGLPPGVRLIEPLALPGQPLQLPPFGHVRSRYAVAVAVSETLAACAGLLERAARAITLYTSDGRRESARVRVADA